MNYTIGIDPGAKGGWAALDEAGAIVSVGTDIRAVEFKIASRVVL
jgi:predicted RNase H-like nuclease (RuvC/YqgF family)